MGDINYFSYVTGVSMCSWVTLTVSVCYWVGMCSWVTLIFQLCYWGRHVFMGYLNKEEQTKETIQQDGFLHSGDIGKKDEDGFIYVTGRIKGTNFTQTFLN